MEENAILHKDMLEGEWGNLSGKLLNWYELYKRDLPWRSTSDPYKIWVSEVILQQTRVDQGLSYYVRFVERFRNVQMLAEASEEEVLKYWQGLGYYSRARNMHAAAKMIMDDHGGVFPSDYHQVLKLKGVGEYTAAAIVSFAWNKAYPVVDGNVFRFLSRLFTIDAPINTNKGKKIFVDIAGELMDKSQAGLFNQAIMEFGALQCIPSSPDCSHCPFESQCMARATSSVGKYPVKQGKIQVKTRYLYYFHIHQEGYTYLNKRSGSGVWRNLYEFPVIESEKPLSFADLQSTDEFKDMTAGIDSARFRLVVENKKHVLSHRLLYASFYEIYLEKDAKLLSEFQKVHESRIDHYPIHRLMQLYLEKCNE